MKIRAKAQALLANRQALIETGALAFFVASLVFLGTMIPRVTRSLTIEEKRPAREVEVVDLTRAPTIVVGPHRYMILGLGQDADTGRSLVWVRSLATGQTGGFAAGDRLFKDPVRVAMIEGLDVELRSPDAASRIALKP